MAGGMTRTARKRHRCDRQIYYDRLSPDAREWHHVTPCPDGGWIEVGTTYEEDEGADPLVTRVVSATKQELLAGVLRRCIGIDENDNSRQDFGDINGGSLQRPTDVAAELLRALSDEGLTIAAIREGDR